MNLPSSDDRVEPSSPPLVERLRQVLDYRDPRIAMYAFIALVVALGVKDHLRGYSAVYAGGFGSNDWLINYGGGFVRRGLFGQLLLIFHGVVSQFGLIPELVSIQVVLLVVGAILFAAAAWRVRNRWVPWVLLSPAALLWSSYAVEGGMRKELLFTILMAALAIACRSESPRTIVSLNAVAFVLLVVYVFSWEAAATLAPSVLVLQYLSLRAVDRRLSTLVPVVTLAVLAIAFGLSALFPGTPGNVAGICRSLVHAGMDVRLTCHGSSATGEIAALLVHPSVFVHKLAGRMPEYLFYGVWLLIALLPFLASGWLRRWWKVAALQLLTLAPICVLGTDWGRWVHVYVIALSALWLATITADEPRERRPLGTIETMGLFVWVTCWSFNYYNYALWVGGFWPTLQRSGVLHLFREL